MSDRAANLSNLFQFVGEVEFAKILCWLDSESLTVQDIARRLGVEPREVFRKYIRLLNTANLVTSSSPAGENNILELSDFGRTFIKECERIILDTNKPLQ